MGDRFRFVDKIDAAPTVRLDLNDEVKWSVARRDFTPPQMRRAATQTMLRDGATIGATTYDNRTLGLTLECKETTQDGVALETQKLARELDRDRNFLEWRPTGATNSIFFPTYRSSASQIQDVIAASALRDHDIEILAEPFGLGLREDLGPFTVNNDPANVSNPQRFDLTGIKGDVQTPLLIEYTASFGVGFPALAMGIDPGSSPYPTVFKQAESFTLGTDTSGAADATASGGTVARCTFATNANMTTRLGPDQFPIAGILPPEYNGTYRVFGRFKQSSGTDVIKVVGGGDLFQGSTITLTSQTAAQVVELGTYNINAGTTFGIGYGSTGFSLSQSGAVGFLLSAQRVSGAGNLDIDYIALIPTGYRYGAWGDMKPVTSGAGVVDAINEVAHPVSNTLTTPTRYPAFVPYVGVFPMVPPGDSRVHIIHPRTASNDTDLITHTYSVTVRYWPRYLYARPLST